MARVLGSVDLLAERLGERELPPYIFIDESIDALRRRLSNAPDTEQPTEPVKA